MAFQISFVSVAVATDGETDLGLIVNSNLTVFPPNAYVDFPQFRPQVCNLEQETVTSFVLHYSMDNFEFEEFVVDPSQYNYYEYQEMDNASDPGSIDSNNKWEGVLEEGECIGFYPRGTVSDEIGEYVTSDFSVDFAEGIGAVSLDDINMTNNEASGYTVEITDQLSDLQLTTRLLTPGTITPTTTVEYELTIANVGNIDDSWGGAGIYVVVPEGVTDVTFTDGDLDDTFTINSCNFVGTVSQLLPQATSLISDGDIWGCEFTNTLPVFPVGAQYEIDFSMTAGSLFSSGQSQVVGGVWTDTNEFDSARAPVEFMEVLQGGPVKSNNLVSLTYDSGALAVNVNRCIGQANPTDIDDACFVVTFNKPIWEPSFDEDDILLNGGGVIYYFHKDSSTQWTIKVNGMTVEGTVEVLLSPGGVLDLSAVSNGVEVLGENTIRYSLTPDIPQSPDAPQEESSSEPSEDSETPITTQPKSTHTNMTSTTTLPGIASADVDNTNTDEPELAVENRYHDGSDERAVQKTDVKGEGGFLILGKFSLTGSNVIDILIFALVLLFAGYIFAKVKHRRRVKYR